MAYATASQFLSKFGLAETSALLADEQRLLTEQLLQDAIAVAANGYWTGDPTEAEQAAAAAALARLERQLVTVSNVMDGYLRSAVMLPLAPADANAGTLEECCLALARCELADDTDNATERMDDKCKVWRAWLKDVQAGRAGLVGSTGEAVAERGRTRSGQAHSQYAWAGFPPTWSR